LKNEIIENLLNKKTFKIQKKKNSNKKNENKICKKKNLRIKKFEKTIKNDPKK